MLNKPSNQVISALAALNGNPNFETVRSWLQESLQSLYSDSCHTKDEVLSRWQQGAAQTVDEFLKKSTEAADVIRKSR